MILIDALYINDGGGKILLDYLVSELEKSEKKIWYLLDDRIRGESIKFKKDSKITFMKADFILRKQFYQEHRVSFTTVLCFGNLPPNIRLKAKVYTYFHQKLYLSLPSGMKFRSRAVFWLKTKILNHLKKNTDYWLVQTELIRAELANKYKIKKDKILKIPFYPPLENTGQIDRQVDKYVYVSNATPHKNHDILIAAFCKFYDLYHRGSLYLTVDDSYDVVLENINNVQAQSYPVYNIGFVNQKELSALYRSSTYHIFPSSSESFGLGIVESIELGCKIIGVDLPYLHAICEPSLTFNHQNSDSIVKALSLSLQETKQSVSKVKNEIATLINLLN